MGVAVGVHLGRVVVVDDGVDGIEGVRLEVHDASALLPRLRRAVPYECEGRGLVLVGGVADRWGVAERNGPGKVVWVECTAVVGG